MKANLQSRTAAFHASPPAAAAAGSLRDRVVTTVSARLPGAALILSLAACTVLTGCMGFLKPAQETAQHFVLTPVPVSGAVSVPAGAPAVGVGQVKLPAYLFDTSLAVRRDTNRIEYMPTALWAERLDTGVQRILAANLATLLPTDKIRLSDWQSGDISAAVFVAIEQFDVDASGRAVLVAWWRIMAPGGDKTLKAGESRLTRQGPAPTTDPAGAVATLSDLLGAMSRDVAAAVRAGSK